MKYLLTLLTLVFLGCKKEAGEGGNARIYGKILEADYNSDFTVLISELPATDTYVYIKYGAKGEGFDDRVKTDYEGNFSFDFLYPGDYELYVYSRDSSFQNLSGETVVKQVVKIEGRKESVQASTMTLLK